MFSRVMDTAVEGHFGKDLSGRLVFIPFTRKDKRYFVDSKSDEEKIRALVKMYRSAIALISVMAYPLIYAPSLVLEVFGGMTPRSHRLAIAISVPLFFWLVLIGLMVMLWLLYRQAVPKFTASLAEVGPDVQLQTTAISTRRRRVVLVCLGVAVLLLAVGLLAIMRRPRTPCPTQSHVCKKVETDSTLQSHPRS
jgi:hypothetical protein